MASASLSLVIVVGAAGGIRLKIVKQTSASYPVIAIVLDEQ